MAGVYTGKAGFSAHIFDFKIRTSQCNRQHMDAIPFYRWINLTRKRTKMSHSMTSDQRIPTANMMPQMNSSLHTPDQQILPMNPYTYAGHMKSACHLSFPHVLWHLGDLHKVTCTSLQYMLLQIWKNVSVQLRDWRIWAWQFSLLRNMQFRVDCWCFMLLMIASLPTFVYVMFPLQFN